MGEKDSDLARIEALIAVMKANDLVEIEIKHGDDKICLRRSGPASVPMVVSDASAVKIGAVGQEAGQPSEQGGPEGPSEELVEIKSPIVGTFYRAPSPDSDAYVEVGSHVEAQTVVCIIEAMKVMNEIKAETSGTVAEIVATTGQAVEYGQVLLRVRPD